MRIALIPIMCFTSFNIWHADNTPFSILLFSLFKLLSPNIIIKDISFSNKLTRHMSPEYDSIILQSNIKNLIKLLSIFKNNFNNTYIYIYIRTRILLNSFVYFVCQRDQLENGTIKRNYTDANNSNVPYFYQIGQRLLVIDLEIKFHEKFRKNYK